MAVHDQGQAPAFLVLNDEARVGCAASPCGIDDGFADAGWWFAVD
jgi:hypothetical protein